MTDPALAALLDERAIGQLLLRYMELNDRGDLNGLVKLLTTDGALVRPSAPDVPIRGRDMILASLRARPLRKARHLVCNVQIDLLGPVHASARSTTVLITATDAGKDVSVGGFDDELEKHDGEWLFRSRRGTTAI